MKYICIDNGAVAELISGREYQSIDFEAGDRLINALSGRISFLKHSRTLSHYQDSEGAFLTTSGNWKKKKFVVIDCCQSAIFSSLPTRESLTTFQKLLRFCSKYWSGGVYNYSEKIMTGSSKAIIFPLPYTNSAPFRVAIEREPMKERLKKRDMDGHFLLVYKSGREGADSTREVADETIFRRVFERLPQVYSHLSQAVVELGEAVHQGQVAATELQRLPVSQRPVHMPSSDWIPLLSNQQKSFVFADYRMPHRLKGPAGTGKTLSLILRTVSILRKAQGSSSPFHALLVTHSEATRLAIENALDAIDEDGFRHRDRKESDFSLAVETLASLCAQLLSQHISETEFVDRDAHDSKILQQMYIEQALANTIKEDMDSFMPLLSNSFRDILEIQDRDSLSAMFQHEISILIKGRAGDKLAVYKNCPPLQYGLPVSTEADKGFVYEVFRRYQQQLEEYGQFDTDDVVISALGQLQTPIWRRRRANEGYDFLAIDETHLFNINELHVFHFFTRNSDSWPISFTIDEAQAVGDRGWNDASSIHEMFGDNQELGSQTTLFSAVFRNSPEIRDFCQSILASGATLFTNFANTLESSDSAFTSADERRAKPVEYIECADDASMIEGAFETAAANQADTDSTRPQVLITTLTEDIFVSLKEFAERTNKPVTILDRRGDFIQVQKAERSGHMVLGHADFVGGLEFNVVIIVGVDRGRVPSEVESNNSSSRSFNSYVAHNRLYVAASRARFSLALLGVKPRGPSDLLKAAFANNLISDRPK